MIGIYLNCTITNLYRQKFSLFIPSKDEILVKNTQTSLLEKKRGWRQWTLILIFCVDVHKGLDPPPCGHHKWMAHYSMQTTVEDSPEDGLTLG